MESEISSGSEVPKGPSSSNGVEDSRGIRDANGIGGANGAAMSGDERVIWGFSPVNPYLSRSCRNRTDRLRVDRKGCWLFL